MTGRQQEVLMIEEKWSLDWPDTERLSSSPFACHHPVQNRLGRTSPSVEQFDRRGMTVPFLLQVRVDAGQMTKKNIPPTFRFVKKNFARWVG